MKDHAMCCNGDENGTCCPGPNGPATERTDIDAEADRKHDHLIRSLDRFIALETEAGYRDRAAVLIDLRAWCRGAYYPIGGFIEDADLPAREVTDNRWCRWLGHRWEQLSDRVAWWFQCERCGMAERADALPVPPGSRRT